MARKSTRRGDKPSSSAPIDFERLGVFYIGREYDLQGDKLLDRAIMLDARDLTTHALCVGMTGSGKTGLCIDLLEEAAIDGVPAIIIDPKGDMTNLLLTFPNLSPEDFRPWINEDDARRKGMNPDDYAAQQAELWRSGLGQWGESGERIRLLRNSVDYVVYTPGSDAGIPVSIMRSFAVPSLRWDTDAELIREMVQGAVDSLLTLIGVEADPVRSREHILLSNLFEYFWRRGEDLDLTKLITSVRNPPVRQIGVFDVDTFFPPKDRFEFALRINNIIASPRFQSWLHGQPLDIPGFLYTPEGKVRHSIFYIAHLNDAERMFFVTMLLDQIIAWMRQQPGTTSLRALVYMDEIFGFFPPVANPPSKRPMLNLLKQARAFGVGVVLTTQNPVDLDYKGLTNAGIWFIGRLQAERDKERLLDGLDSATAQVGQKLSRDKIGRLISSLKNRVFLLHNVREEAPVVFHSRWAMSYLRGPLTRIQVSELMGGRQREKITAMPTLEVTPSATRHVSIGSARAEFTRSPPILSPEIKQVYLPVRKTSEAQMSVEKPAGTSVRAQTQNLIYKPALLGIGRINYLDMRRGVNEQESYALLSWLSGIGEPNWERAIPLELTVEDLADTPEPDAYFEHLPRPLGEAKELRSMASDLIDYLYRTRSLTLLYSPILKCFSKPKEDQRDFLIRLKQIARERRDAEVDDLRRRYEDRLRRLEDRLRRAEATLAKRQADSQARKGEVAISIGESILGMFMGRKSTRAASTAYSKYRQSKTATMSVKESQEAVEALQREVQELRQELQDQIADITARWEQAATQLDSIPVRPSRSDVRLDMFALAWVPHWKVNYIREDGSSHEELVPAYA